MCRPLCGTCARTASSCATAASFGLPGTVRLGVLPPAAQDALRQAWRAGQGR